MRKRNQALHWTLPALAWLLGLALLQQCRRLPGEAEFAACVLATAAALVLALRVPHLLSWSLAALLLAFSQGAWRAEMRLADALAEAWEGRDLQLLGRVDSLPSATVGQGGTPGWRFEFALEGGVDPASGQPVKLPPQLMLSWYAQPYEDAPALRAGERWRLLARLKRPHGLMNPHAFDYELWMFEQNLRATGVVRPGVMLKLAESPWWSLDDLRQHLREALQKRVADPSSAGLLAALSLGDQAAISRSDWALFRDTGIAHLVAISGLHVTMFAWGAQALVGWLWRRSGRLCLWLPAPQAALWAGVLAAWLYALFSGWGVPSQRTVWMLASVALLRSLGLRWPWPLILLASGVIVTAIDPWAVGQAGFWLSFAAVGLLMASGEAPAGKGLKAHLKQGLHSQSVATLGLAPLSLLFFQQISVVGLLANLLAIPWVSFVITPLALGGALLPGLWVWAEWCAQALMAYLRLLDRFSWAVWSLPVAPLWAQLAGLAGGVLLVLPLPWRLRGCGLALLLPLLWPAPPRPRAGEFELLAADIGQGTAVLLRTASHQMLYDSGPQYAPGVDAGQRVLLPLLRALGVDRLDMLMLSHRDSDHVGGAASLLAGLPVAALHSSLEPAHPLLINSPPKERCEAGQQWDWDGVHFELLHPTAGHYEQALKSNAMSCLLRISSPASGRSALLTGDIEAAQELSLLTRSEPAALHSDVLLVPHHGSKTSSTDALLAAVAPRIAVVQAGYRNRFGHPAPPVLARYQAHGIALVASPDCGAWQWRSADGSWVCQRELALRYWHRRPSALPTAEQVGPWQDGEPGY
ncbi:DNA internalization-related competence protein ComEC/Rec2 [soil metagenome]